MTSASLIRVGDEWAIITVFDARVNRSRDVARDFRSFRSNVCDTCYIMRCTLYSRVRDYNVTIIFMSSKYPLIFLKLLLFVIFKEKHTVSSLLDTTIINVYLIAKFIFCFRSVGVCGHIPEAQFRWMRSRFGINGIGVKVRCTDFSYCHITFTCKIIWKRFRDQWRADERL